ncbi:vacuolar protein sorting-associated protein 35 [Zychaea mexicana]|uniref:vacuolar protein sorting-associated protein 35 n=1 Tax=Zychaea mexicana TaxID=64656 RepID=UPI0022FE33FE|nr:vacuolar protein sorting-associated protein 35 [Zychaea mexicana]KAI9492819.1 vacuolar protein sorting-associated protein 35 [Zychaea mexicana]
MDNNFAPNSPAPASDQNRLLDEVVNVVKVQAHQMKKCLDNNRLMDGLKHCSNMLAELRTSALTPKNYYELYMAIFDALRHLSIYLTEAHQSGRHHLADLYELVQYAGNIVPRLYLMITVGAAYMGMGDAPIREIMRDMMEMSRGVQHPIRGLFLRHYLSGLTRDYLPEGESKGPEGNVQESIEFVLTNFTEMNKLWVRLQHQGHSRDREKREAERKELRILVGTNLVRLSQLEGVDLETYRTSILPGVLDQVVSCRDVIAQEYLMEVIIQVFPDEFHLRTLQPFLSATAQLHPKVNVKQIIIALIDRLAAYAAREADVEVSQEKRRAEEDAVRRAVLAKKRQANGEPEPEQSLAPATTEEKEESKPEVEEEKKEEETGDDEESAAVKNEEEVESPLNNPDAEPDENKEDEEAQKEDDKEDTAPAATVEQPLQEESEENGKIKKEEETEEDSVKRIRGIPEDVELFQVFWTQIVELVKVRPDLSIQDLTALLVSLINLSLSCYPTKLNYVDQILAFAKEKMTEYSDSPDLHSKATEASLLALLLAPINQYTSVLTLLALENYQLLLALQPFTTRRAVAHAVISSVLKNETIIGTPDDVYGVLELCQVLLCDQKDAPVATTTAASPTYARGKKPEFTSIEEEEYVEEQGWIAKMVHLLRSDNEDTQFLLLSQARKQLANGGDRIRFTYPSLVVSAVKLARRYRLQESQDEVWEKKTSTLFRFIHQVVSTLNHKCDSPDICLRLFLLAGQSADESRFEEIAYEFFVEAFTIYEEAISESRAQFQAIISIVGALQQTRVFSADNYDTLITKAALHSAKLLKKPDQCRAVYLSSHLWWMTERSEDDDREQLFRNGKRALECLQKALKIADSCMDAATNVELFVEILNQYIYYFERGNDAVTPKYLNGLIDLINTNLSNMDNPDQHPPAANSSSLVEHNGQVAEYAHRHFRATLAHLQQRKAGSSSNEWEGAKYSEIDAGDL